MNAIDDRIIELKELRIGNLLEYKGELVQITSLSCDIDDEYEDQICFVKYRESTNEIGGWNRSLVNDLKRITLTADWLVRFGFETSGNQVWVNRIDEYSLLIIHLDGRYELFDTIDGQSVVSRDNKIQFVHKLQNLYFALTGEELTIKETV